MLQPTTTRKLRGVAAANPGSPLHLNLCDHKPERVKHHGEDCPAAAR
jgi:hypothetical protein